MDWSNFFLILSWILLIIVSVSAIGLIGLTFFIVVNLKKQLDAIYTELKRIGEFYG